jgi:hypothetical protein
VTPSDVLYNAEMRLQENLCVTTIRACDRLRAACGLGIEMPQRPNWATAERT